MKTTLLFGLGLMILILSTCSANPVRSDHATESQIMIAPMCSIAADGQGCPDLDTPLLPNDSIR